MAVKIQQVSKYYGEQCALDNISFTIDSGHVLGILGPNGAGKSTLLKIITGYLQPTNGKVWVNDYPIENQNIKIKKIIGYLPENNPLYSDLYVMEYLNLIAGIYQIRDKRKRISEIIEITGLSIGINKKIGQLSKGYRQRIGIAQALIHDPQVLILDEPTSGLDPAQLIEIRQLIKNISIDKTVLLSTHLMQEVEAVCDQIMILNKGSLIAMDTPSNIKNIKNSTIQRVEVEFAEKILLQKLLTIEGVSTVDQLPENKWLLSGIKGDIRSSIFRFAVKNNYTLLTLSEKENSIEKSFLELVK